MSSSVLPLNIEPVITSMLPTSMLRNGEDDAVLPPADKSTPACTRLMALPRPPIPRGRKCNDVCPVPRTLIGLCCKGVRPLHPKELQNSRLGCADRPHAPARVHRFRFVGAPM